MARVGRRAGGMADRSDSSTSIHGGGGAGAGHDREPTLGMMADALRAGLERDRRPSRSWRRERRSAAGASRRPGILRPDLVLMDFRLP